MAAVIATSLSTIPVITAQNNVSNFGKVSTGNYNVTFASALANADYIIKGMAKSAGTNFILTYTAKSTTGFSVHVANDAGVAADPAEVLLEATLV